MAGKESTLFRKSTLERVSSPDQLNEYIKIVNPSLIVMLIGIFGILIAGAAWVLFGGIPKTVELNGVVVSDYSGNQKLYCYVPVSTSKRLESGMSVQISPEHAPRATYGYLQGRIDRVSDDVVTEDYLTSKFENPQIVLPAINAALQDGNVVEIEIDLGCWSSSKGEDVEITDGVGCSASVIVGETKPYELMFNQ